MKKFETKQDAIDWLESIPADKWTTGNKGLDYRCEKKCILGHLGSSMSYELEGLPMENAKFIYDLFISNPKLSAYIISELDKHYNERWENLWMINDRDLPDDGEVRDRLINFLKEI